MLGGIRAVFGRHQPPTPLGIACGHAGAWRTCPPIGAPKPGGGGRRWLVDQPSWPPLDRVPPGTSCRSPLTLHTPWGLLATISPRANGGSQAESGVVRSCRSCTPAGPLSILAVSPSPLTPFPLFFSLDSTEYTLYTLDSKEGSSRGVSQGGTSGVLETRGGCRFVRGSV